jgi:hypothetical protein
MDVGTKEAESSTGCVWAAGFHQITARSLLACILKLMNVYFFNFPFFLDCGKPPITETADNDSADTGA